MAANVLVVVTESRADGLASPAREALAVAHRLAGQLSGSVSVAAAKDAVSTELMESGVARVYVHGGSLPGASMVALAAEATRLSEARVVIVNRGPVVLDLVPRLAMRLAGGAVMGVTSLDVIDGDISVEAAIYGGAARAAYRFKGAGPRVISLAAGASGAAGRVAGRNAEVVELALPGDDRVRIVEAASTGDGPRLEDARVVVSGGRGLRDRENYALIRELAAALNGMPGASRAIVDDGWAKPEEQVGLTGRIVTPELYVAAGISGASQHMAGCSNARTLVAINTDPDAPIFRYAHFGIDADALEVLPELIRVIRERSGS